MKSGKILEYLFKDQGGKLLECPKCGKENESTRYGCIYCKQEFIIVKPLLERESIYEALLGFLVIGMVVIIPTIAVIFTMFNDDHSICHLFVTWIIPVIVGLSRLRFSKYEINLTLKQFYKVVEGEESKKQRRNNRIEKKKDRIKRKIERLN